MDPEGRTSPAFKALLLVALIGSAVVLGFHVVRTIESAASLRGESVLVIEKIGDVEGSYALDVDRTKEEAPDFDRLLFLAYRSGKSPSNDAATVTQVRAYLDSLAQEQGHERFDRPPYENVFSWDDATFRVIYFGQP